MPQMAPISWIILFFIFTITFILFNILNYYCFNKMNKTQSMQFNFNKNNSLNWKW